MANHFSSKSKFTQSVKDTKSTWPGLAKSGEPLPTTLPDGVQLCPTGLILPDELEQNEWEEIGTILARMDIALQWSLGDWWAFGHHKYGDRAATVAAKKLPYEFQTLMNFGSVARRVTTSRRSEVLTFSHHAVVAKLEPDDQTKWLVKAERMKWSVKKLSDQLAERVARDELEPTIQAQKLASKYRKQAKIARPMLVASWDDPRLDFLNYGGIDELVNEATQTAEFWNELASRLKEYQEKRL